MEFEHSRAKVKNTVSILGKHCHRCSALIYLPILISYHTNVYYNNIFDKFDVKRSRAKAKVTVAIFRKTLSSLGKKTLSSLQCPHLKIDFDFISYKYLI